MRKKLAYVNADCYVDTDLTVLKHLARQFDVVWYPVYYTDRRIYYTPDEMLAYAQENGIEVYLCPRLYRQRDPRNYGFYLRIVEDINARGADIVYSCIVEELYWTLASRKLWAKRILGLHDVVMHSFDAPVKRFIQTCIREWGIRTSRNVCVFSENQARLFERRYGRIPEKLALCCRNLGPSSADIPDISKGVSLLFFGNIVEYKGLDLLISAMERVRSHGIDNLSLTIAGRGDFWEKCQGLIKTPEMFRLEIRFIENAEIPDLLVSHHFLVLPYRDVTQSGPLMLAAGYGIPVLAPDFDCFKEYYNPQAAILYTHLDDALRQLSSLTPHAYFSVRQNASLLKDVYSEEAISNRYIQYFKSLE